MATPAPASGGTAADGADSGRLDVPAGANTGCVGTQSDAAGKASGCDGCPNQSACASGAFKKPDPATKDVAMQLASIRHTIVVLSGKGGVGKSTFSAQLAFSLAAAGNQVGLLDVDICGPSIPRMLGLVGRSVHQSTSGWSPVWLSENLGVMSIGFMLPDVDDAVVWRGPRKDGLIRNFLKDVEWGPLDYLIIDTPPGTSDEHISIVQYLKNVAVDGAVIVTTPQEVAMADVRKELNFCKKVQLNVLGVVENMSGFVCPCCKTKTDIFAAPAAGGPAAMAAKFGVPFLGSIPLDPRMMASCDTGEPFSSRHPTSPAAKPFLDVVTAAAKAVGEVFDAEATAKAGADSADSATAATAAATAADA